MYFRDVKRKEMIVLRNKLFVGRDDGFEGKKGKIFRVSFLKKSDSYRNFGPWRVKLSDNALEELEDDEVFSDRDIIKIRKIVKELETRPFQGSFGQHPLWEFDDKDRECTVWSAIIDEGNRLNYLVYKQQNYILVTNLIGHNVINIGYAKRPKI